MMKLISDLGRNQRGAITLFLVFAITTLLTASALAFELARYTKTKARFNNAVDQSLLATASANAPNPLDYATGYLRTALVLKAAGKFGDALQGNELTVNNFVVSVDANRTQWRAVANAQYFTSFGRFLGINSLEMNHEAAVTWDMNKKTEIVALMDVSGTMCAKFERIAQQDGSTVIEIVPDPACTKLNQMKEALKQIVSIGVGYNGLPGTPAYKAGIVPFTFKVKVANPGAIPAFVTQGEVSGGFGTDYYTNLTDAEASGPPIPPVTPLMNINNESDKDAFKSRAQALSTGTNTEISRPFMKRSAVGATFAALMMDPAYQGVFGGVAPDALGSSTRKIVILMTDSANLGCCFTNWPADNFRNNYVYSYSPDHNALVGGNGNPGICQAMKDRGIEIFTVLFDVDRRDMDLRGEQIVDSFQSCASTPDKAFEVAFNDTEKLREVYTIIGKSIMNLRLSE